MPGKGRPFAKGHAKLPGAGMKKGYKYPATLERERVAAAIQAHILSQAELMVGAQIEHAKGEAYMVLRRPDGTFAVATEEKQVQAAVAIGGEAFAVHTRAPNTSAFMALMDRALGKPTEHTELNVTGSLDIVQTLARRHKPRA